jgi:hypothetical protein
VDDLVKKVALFCLDYIILSIDNHETSRKTPERFRRFPGKGLLA